MSRLTKLLLVILVGLGGTALFTAGWLARGNLGGVAEAQGPLPLPIRALSHFQCYDLDEPPPPFQVTLIDQYSIVANTTLDRAVMLCAPVTKTVTSGTPQPFTGDHLKCYRTTGGAIVAKPHDVVTLRNQFGVERNVDLVSRTPRQLCVPTQKIVGATCEPPFTVRSGNGVIGGTDAVVQFRDALGNWQPAFIINPNPAYAVIAGTQWVSLNAAGTGQANTTTRYRAPFQVPPECATTCLTVSIQIHADNAATVFLNNIQRGQQPQGAFPANFQAPPSVFTVTGFLPAQTMIEFTILNVDGPTGLDFLATVSVAQPPLPIACLIANPQ